jgi:hypothetical protein
MKSGETSHPSTKACVINKKYKKTKKQKKTKLRAKLNKITL